MVTNAMLREAAGEVEHAMLASLSAKDIAPHKFSARFEKKMKKLINKVKHPIRYNVLRSAAAIILIIFTIFGSLVAFSPEVRANVINWFKSTFMSYTQYSSDGNNSNIEYEYFFPTVPGGYSELKIIDSKDGKTYLYINKEAHLLQFTYAYGSRSDNFFVKTDLHTHIEGFVNGNKADIYITSSDDDSNAIVWIDAETETLLYINAKVSRDLLVEFAESVTKTPN